MLRGDSYAVSLDCGANCINCLILPDKMLFKALIKLRKASVFVLSDAAGGDFCPQLNYPCKVINAKLRGALSL